MKTATDSSPAAPATLLLASLDNPSIATSELFQGIATQTENRPQSSPKSGASLNRHKSNQAYATPPNFIRACETIFGRRVVWDLAASAANAKADRFYDEEMNSLVQPWHQISAPGGMLWLNPPFGNIAPWAEKCAVESMISGCAPILLFTPASIGSDWFREHVMGKALVLALNGRIVFDGQSEPDDWREQHPGKQWKPQGYPKDLMLSVYGLGAPDFRIWTVPREALK